MFKYSAALAMTAIDALRDMAHFEAVHAPAPQPAMTGHSRSGASRFDPKINRHTGKPHEHCREIARNLARAA